MYARTIREKAVSVIKTLDGQWQTLDILAKRAGLINGQMARFLTEHLFGNPYAVAPFVDRSVIYRRRTYVSLYRSHEDA